ncbi:MAG: hypothetical protein ACLR02_12275 [Clostridium sp.]
MGKAKATGKKITLEGKLNIDSFTLEEVDGFVEEISILELMKMSGFSNGENVKIIVQELDREIVQEDLENYRDN